MEGSYFEELPENHRRAVLVAIGMLTDEFTDDVARLLTSDKLDFTETSMSAFLPGRLAHRYSPLFAKKFLASFHAAAWKMVQPTVYALSCVAEEFAAEAIVAQAEGVLELEGEGSNYGYFRDGIFEDMDFESLFHAELDGIEDSDIAEEMGMGNLRFEDWFKQFSPEHSRVAPYAEGA